MKRYYVEVMGLGEDGETQLVEAGIAHKAILVVDEEEQRNLVAMVIREVTGISFGDIRSKMSSRYVVMARGIYVHFRMEMGVSVGKICVEIGRVPRDIYRIITDYETKMVGDREFANEVDDVRKRLESFTEWADAKREAKRCLRIAKHKKRKRRRLSRKVQRPRSAEKKDNDSKQLYINF